VPGPKTWLILEAGATGLRCYDEAMGPLRQVARVARLVAIAGIGALSAGCYRPATYQCHTPYAHPTMSPGDVAQLVDVRVRAVTEGATGGVASTMLPLSTGRDGGFVW